jgi:valyl-tRNA synthetase
VSDEALELARRYAPLLAKAREVERLVPGEHPSGEPSALVSGVGEVFVLLQGIVEPGELRERLARELAKVEKELAQVESKLARPDFLERAPQAVVDKERERADTLRARAASLERHLQALR